MANSDTPTGLSPIRYTNGTPYNGGATRYYIPATDTTAAYLGAPVALAGSADADGVPTVTANVAANAALLGAVVSVQPVTQDSTTFRAASTGRYVYVADNPDLIFEIQEDSVGGALTAANVGNVANLTGFGSGENINGRSAVEIDSSTATASGTGNEQVSLLGLIQSERNEFGDNANFLVRINNHQLSNNFTGA